MCFSYSGSSEDPVEEDRGGIECKRSVWDDSTDACLQNKETSSNNHRALAKLFLEQPTLDMNCVDNSGMKALHHACVGSCAGVVRRLLNKEGVEVNAKDYYGRTPLMAAVEECADNMGEIEKRRIELVRLMVEVKGIDLDTRYPLQLLGNKERTLEEMAG